jgi:hypothetical protein
VIRFYIIELKREAGGENQLAFVFYTGFMVFYITGETLQSISFFKEI